MRCLQMSGCESAILGVFDKICPQKFTETQLQGQEEADILLFSPNDLGNAKCIGPATVLWHPAGNGNVSSGKCIFSAVAE